MKKQKYVGYCPKHELPFKAGDSVLIPKGTMVRNLHRGEYPAGRTYTVTVNHILSGAEYQNGGPDGPTVINPKVCWAGTGGYWSECDINDILEAN